jgi:hypothetical protein
MLWLDDPSDLSRIIGDAGRVTTAGNGNTIAAAASILTPRFASARQSKNSSQDKSPSGGE